MNMVCPECHHTESFAALPMRLQTCPRCNEAGEDQYLTVPSLEVRAPIPVRPITGRVMDERRRLGEGRPQLAT
jgi:hypothetical protein